MSSPSAGKPDRARLRRAQHRHREEARADLGAARAVHDRDPPAAADVLVEPVVRAAVPRLARRDDGAQRREVGIRARRAGSARARASARRRASSRARRRRVCHTRSCGPVRRALHEDDRRAARHRADDGPRPHDPAHVRREEHAVAGVGGPPGRRSRARSTAGTRPGRAARPSACPSCPTCTRGGTAPRSRPRRPRASPGCPATASSHQTSRPAVIGHVDAGPSPDEHALDARRVRERLVEHLLHRDELPAAVRRVGGDHELRAGVGEPRRTRRGRRSRRRSAPAPRRCARTRATRSRPRAPSAGTCRRRRPRRRRARRSASASRAHLVRELGPRQRAPLALLGHPHRGLASGVSRAQRWTHASATLSRAPTNHVVHSIPRESSSTASQSRASGIPRSATTARQNRSGSSIETR